MNKNKEHLFFENFIQNATHQGPIYALDQDEHFYYSASADKYVARWNKADLSQDPFVVRCSHAPFSLLVLANLNLLVIGLQDGQIHIINTRDKRELKHIKVHRAAVFVIVHNEHKNHFYTADSEGLVCIWDENWKLLLQQPLSCGKIRQILISKDGASIWLACADGTARQLDTIYFNEIQQIKAHSDACTSLTLLTDGGFISAGKDAFIRRWSAEGKKLNAFAAHLGTIYKLIQINVNLYASASRDKTIKIWQLTDDRIVQKLDFKHAGHSNSINALIPTSKGFLSAGDDKRIIEWRQTKPKDVNFES